MNSKEFSLIIEGVVKDKRPITYMDAIIWYCEQNQIEVESVGRLISKALKENSLNWSYENLYLFLEKPKEWAPGTKMSYRGISKQVNLANVLKYLAHISKLNES